MENKSKVVFVAMPFTPEFDDAYLLAIKPACDRNKVECNRVDDQIFFQNILERIYEEIDRSDIVIGEMSSRNTNVYYEVGYAHGIGKPVILITKSAEDIPFDLRHYPHIVYGGSLATLKSELEKRLDWFIENYEDALKQGPKYAMGIKALGAETLNQSNSTDSLLNFFLCKDISNDRLDIEVAIKENLAIVLYYSLPLKVHIRKIEYFMEEKEIVFYSEQNTRRTIGLPLTEPVTKHILKQKEIILVRKLVPSMNEVSAFKVPFKVYE